MKTINIILTVLSFVLMIHLTTYVFNNEGLLFWLGQRLFVLTWLIMTGIGLYITWTTVTKELTKKDNDV